MELEAINLMLCTHSAKKKKNLMLSTQPKKKKKKFDNFLTLVKLISFHILLFELINDTIFLPTVKQSVTLIGEFFLFCQTFVSMDS